MSAINLIFENPTGTRADADSATLPNGIRRTDTGAVLPGTAGATLPRVALGSYSYTFADPALNLTYSYDVLFIQGGLHYPANGRLLAGPTSEGSTPTSALFTYDKFVRRWGLTNIATASNKSKKPTDASGNPAPDFAAVQDAFDYATSEVYDRFRGSGYAVPLDFSQNNGVCPASLQDIAMVIAYSNLYDARGLDEKDKTANKIIRLEDVKRGELMLMASGVRQLPLALDVDSTGRSTSPGALALEGRCTSPVRVGLVDGALTFLSNP